MAGTHFSGPLTVAGVEVISDAGAIVGDIQATAGSIGTAEIAADAVTEVKVADSDGTGGLYLEKYALAVYDFAVDGGTEGTITLADTATLPDNAVVTAVEYDVITTCTSSSDAATIKLNLPTDGDLTTAIAISDASNSWDAGVFSATSAAGAFTNDPASVKTTAARALQIITAGGQDLTAGKIVFKVRYWVSA